MPQIDRLGKMSPVLGVSTHIYGVSKEIQGKTFIFWVNLGMWPLKSIISEKWALFWGFNTYLWGFSGDWWQNVHFSSKPRHVTPQIEHLGKMSPVMMVSTHVYRISKEIDGKIIHFSSKPRHVTPQIDCLRKISPVLRVSTHIYGVSKEIDGKTFIFQVNLGMWPLKSIVSEKKSPVLRVSTHIYGVSKEIQGKTFIFQVNLGMWPLKSIVSKKEPCFEGFNTHLWGFSGDRWENIHFSSKPRHVTPQIDCLGKMSPVLGISIHIYGVSQEIDWKTFIFRVNLGMWPLKLLVSEKRALFWGFQHTFMGFPWR